MILYWILSYLENGNVALHQDTEVRYLYGPNFPSYLLVDGRDKQPSCIDFDPFPDGRTIKFKVVLDEAKSIRHIRMDFIYQGIGKRIMITEREMVIFVKIIWSFWLKRITFLLIGQTVMRHNLCYITLPFTKRYCILNVSALKISIHVDFISE
jgi:hypothetical protein